MRLTKQGSICDICGTSMKPHEKYAIKYEKTAPDKSKKVVASAISCTCKATDLCEKCFMQIANGIESKFFYPRKPHMAFLEKCKRVLC